MRKYIFLLALIGIFLSLRLINLSKFPLYIDEGIYINWAKQFFYDKNLAYIGLQDGKTPLFMWLTAYFYPFFKNFLLSARVISVVAASVTIFSWIIIFRSNKLPKAAVVFWLISLTCPFGFLIERMGFVDSLLTAFSSLSLMTAFLAFQRLKQDKSWFKIILLAVFNGVILGLGYMTKTTIIIVIIAEILVYLFWAIELWGLGKKKQVLKIAFYGLLSFLFYRELVSYLRVGGAKSYF